MKTIFTKDLPGKKIHVKREFAGPINVVWKAWTDSKILEQWWAPKPWKAVTKKMDFREGGSWLYYMQGPEGEKHWSKAEYEKVNPVKSFEGLDAFCDENGVVNNDMPRMHWKVEFVPSGSTTLVNIEITFPTQEDLTKIMEMGFQEGFTMAHGNLDEVLAEQAKQ